MKSSVHNNGMRVLWRGMSPTLLACIPAHALYFSIYESMKVYLGGKNTGNILHLKISVHSSPHSMPMHPQWPARSPLLPTTR